MIPAMLQRLIPAQLRPALTTTVELLQGARTIGPEDPPPIWAGLFQSVAQEHGVEPELLAAVACVLTGFDPDHLADDHSRAGLLAVPLASADEASAVTATLAELADRNKAAVARVRANATAAALQLAELRATPGVGLAGAIMQYCGGDALQAATVLGVFVIYAARQLEGMELDVAALVG